jgi:hypothetical protein
MAKGRGAWSKLLAADHSNDKGDLDRVQAELWHAIRCCRTGLDESIEEHDVEEVRRWCHCLAQISAAYTRTFREAELIPMIKELERARDARSSHRLLTQDDFERLYRGAYE